MKFLALALGLLTFFVTPRPVTGQATYYAPDVMRQVYAYRLRVGDVRACPECVGMVALLRPEHIGRKVWLEHPNGSIIGPLLVVDCARQQDMAGLLRRKWVVDVSWELARQWRMRGPLADVTVHFTRPRSSDLCTNNMRSEDGAQCGQDDGRRGGARTDGE